MDLAEACLRWWEQWADAEAQLLWWPPGASASDRRDQPRHLVPQSAWHALGLLARGGEGDAERAGAVLEAVLALQYDEPGTVIDGTFARFAETPMPGPEPRIWDDYAPNWRQFVGTTFTLVASRFGDRLPPGLVERLEEAVTRAVDGEPEGRVTARYSNIALMKAWLEIETGARTGRVELVAAGEALASEVVAGYDEHGAFEEYNSPTYYGIDLYALALWRSSASEQLRLDGARLEAALWSDVARWYHSGLRNLSGPFTRSYGMDMTGYVGLLGFWIWDAVGVDHAPLPRLDGPVDHGMDVALGPVVALLGARVPEDVLPALTAFQGERLVEQRITEVPDRVATAWLSGDVMLGGERSPADLSWWDQYHAATAHWRLPHGGVGWLRAVVPGPSDAVARPGALALRWSEPGRDGRRARLVVHAPGVTAAAVADGVLSLPGVTMGLDTDAGPPAVAEVEDGLELSWAWPGRPCRFDLHVEA